MNTGVTNDLRQAIQDRDNRQAKLAERHEATLRATARTQQLEAEGEKITKHAAELAAHKARCDAESLLKGLPPLPLEPDAQAHEALRIERELGIAKHAQKLVAQAEATAAAELADAERAIEEILAVARRQTAEAMLAERKAILARLQEIVDLLNAPKFAGQVYGIGDFGNVISDAEGSEILTPPHIRNMRRFMPGLVHQVETIHDPVGGDPAGLEPFVAFWRDHDAALLQAASEANTSTDRADAA
jgi:hypothetical protein